MVGAGLFTRVNTINELSVDTSRGELLEIHVRAERACRCFVLLLLLFLLLPPLPPLLLFAAAAAAATAAGQPGLPITTHVWAAGRAWLLHAACAGPDCPSCPAHHPALPAPPPPQFDMTFPAMPCAWLSVDVMDISGEVQLVSLEAAGCRSLHSGPTSWPWPQRCRQHSRPANAASN